MSEDDIIERGDAPRDGSTLAAEHALGLLEGEELLTARGRVANDPAFAALVAMWEDRLAPLADEIAGAEPSADLWPRIEERIAAHRATIAQAELVGGGGSATNVIDIEERVRRWQWTAALTSAAAAVMLAVLVFAPDTGPVPSPTATENPALASTDPLYAQVPIGDTGLRIDVTYMPDSETMLVGAIGLTPDGVHDHELWLVPDDGSALQSLGVVVPGEVQSMALPQDIARNLGSGVGLVLTREPIGGKPEGQDAGPVVAEGAFSTV
ncbi:MAG: anti-sigma factor [Erythrobacter sp.]